MMCGPPCRLVRIQAEPTSWDLAVRGANQIYSQRQVSSCIVILMDALGLAPADH